MKKIDHISNTGTAIGWLERVLSLVKKYSMLDFIKTFLIIFLTGALVFFISEPEKVIEYYTRAAKEKHNELLMARRENSTQIQNSITRLLYKVGADRVVITELHNGQTSNAGIPFLKTTATFEALGDSIFPVSSQYQNCQLSLFPFATYLHNEGYFEGDVKTIKEIDKSLYYKLLSNDVGYFASGTLMGKDKIIGFLVVTFKEKPEYDKENFLINEMRKTAQATSLLLELRETSK